MRKASGFWTSLACEFAPSALWNYSCIDDVASFFDQASRICSMNYEPTPGWSRDIHVHRVRLTFACRGYSSRPVTHSRCRRTPIMHGVAYVCWTCLPTPVFMVEHSADGEGP